MYRSARHAARLTIVALVTVALGGCDIAMDGHGGFDFGLTAGQATDEWTRTYNVTAGGRLEIVNVNGRITAEASDGPAVEIKAERSAKAPTNEGAKELLVKIEYREELGDNRVRSEV